MCVWKELGFSTPHCPTPPALQTLGETAVGGGANGALGTRVLSTTTSLGLLEVCCGIRVRLRFCFSLQRLQKGVSVRAGLLLALRCSCGCCCTSACFSLASG